MLLPGRNLVKVYEDKVRCGEGLGGYMRELMQMVGYHRTPYGPAVGKNALFNPTEFSLVEVAEAFMGRDLHSTHRQQFESGLAMESIGGGALTAAQFGPVSAAYGSVTGLLNSEMLKGYTDAPTTGRQMVDWKSGVQAEEVKIWDYTEPTEVFDDLREGQQRPDGNMNAEWVRAAKLKEQGQTLKISWRAVHFAANSENTFDLAGKMGRTASWVIEDRILDVLFGLSGSYVYGNSTAGDTETTYQTYIASGGPYANYQTNELVDETSLAAANVLLRSMRNPSTGRPIDIGQTKNLVVSSLYEPLATQLARFNQTILGKDSDATRLLVGQTTALGIQPFISARMEDRHVLKGFQGGALNMTQARKRWLWGDTKTAFQYRQARDFTIVSSTVADEKSLAQYGLIAKSVYDEMGSTTVIQPRAVVLNRKDS